MCLDKKSWLKITVVTLLFACTCSYMHFNLKGQNTCNAFPFYNLKPSELVVRSEFYTSYQTSSEERKSNIYLASKAINNTFIDVGGEFSFNLTVGARTEKRGYKKAKIIVDGQFVEGVGGGVCQVSTTLYNAVLLAGLKITEYHPHSLQVSYVSPSFDAMVNSGSADLRFVNNTYNPIIISAVADGKILTISIIGEQSDIKYERKSIVVGEIPAPQEEVVYDDNNEFPDLYEGEYNVVRYSKKGLKSEGYLVESKDGKYIRTKKIRSDSYSAVKGLIVYGRAERPEILEDIPIEQSLLYKIRGKFLKCKKYFDKNDFL